MESLRDTLQPILQPVTHNLPAPVRDLGVSLLGETCYASLVLDIDVADAACLKLAVSKALGMGIVAASSVVKVPQILNLTRSRSASGVSFLSYLLETTSYLISLAYNVRNGFPFSTYGETALILGQNVVISVLVLNYSGRAGVAALFVAMLAAAAASLFSAGLVDMNALGYLQAGAGTLGVASKVPQILAIWQEGGTGQLSAFTVSPSLFICCCRWAPTGDDEKKPAPRQLNSQSVRKVKAVEVVAPRPQEPEPCSFPSRCARQGELTTPFGRSSTIFSDLPSGSSPLSRRWTTS